MLGCPWMCGSVNAAYGACASALSTCTCRQYRGFSSAGCIYVRICVVESAGDSQGGELLEYGYICKSRDSLLASVV